MIGPSTLRTNFRKSGSWRCLGSWAAGTFLLVCILASAQAGGADQIDRMLDEADASRTSDMARVDRILDRLEEMVGEAGPLQMQRIRVLRAHRLITRGDSAAATEELRAVLADQPSPSTKLLAASMLANTFAIQRKFEDSLRMLDLVLSSLDSVDERELRHRGLLVATAVYSQVGEFALAMKYADMVATDSPSDRSACALSPLILEAKAGLMQHFSDSEASFAIDRCVVQGESIFAAFARWHLASEWVRQNRQADATAMLESTLAEVERSGYPFIIAQYHALLADLTFQKGDFGKARAHADRAILQISGNSAGQQALVTAHHVKFKIAERQGDMTAALAAYRLYAEAERAHFNDVKSREMAYQVVRHQSLQQAQQIELLHQKNELLELQKRVTEQRAQNWLLLALVLIAGMTSVGYWAYKTKRLQVRLKRMTETDALTGICNRQHFSERAAAALVQCARDAEPAVLVMFDLDHFKQVNDRFGHAAGDWALQRVAEAVRPLCRSVDAFGRLGGEEFALFLPGLDATAAIRLAGDAQARFGAIDAGSAGYAFRIAASFGVASVDSAGYSLAALMRQADQAMYAAKRGGRRQVRVFDAAMEADASPTAAAPVDLLRSALRGDAIDAIDAAARQASGSDTQRAIA